MSAPTRQPGVWDVAIALVFIVVGVSLAASLLFLFIGAPMVMIGVEMLMPRTGNAFGQQEETRSSFSASSPGPM
jgi:hypothetical protein